MLAPINFLNEGEKTWWLSRSGLTTMYVLSAALTLNGPNQLDIYKRFVTLSEKLERVMSAI